MCAFNNNDKTITTNKAFSHGPEQSKASETEEGRARVEK